MSKKTKFCVSFGCLSRNSNFKYRIYIVDHFVQKGDMGLVKKIDHIGIAVKSVKESLPFYTETLKLKLIGIEEVESEGVKVAFLKIGESKIELLEPLHSESPIAKYIEKKGEGIHHIAVGIDNIKERIHEIQQQGLKMINPEPKTGAGGAQIAFMHPKSTGGVLYELCEKPQKEEQ